MLKKIAWNTFEKTGNINTFLELKKLDNISNLSDSKDEEIFKNTLGDISGNSKNNGYCN